MTQHFLVTGVSTGIGYAIARDLIAAGHHVFGSVRKAADGEKVRAELGEGFTPLHFDVTDAEAIAAAVPVVEAIVGADGLSGLVNNAGVAPSGPLMHMPIEEFETTLAINITGVLRVTQAFLPLLGAGRQNRNGPGRIVNMSSISGGVTVPMVGAYAVSKHGLEALTDGMRREFSIYGIHVAAIEPGAIRTPIWTKAASEISGGRYAGTDFANSMRVMAEMSADEAKNGKPVEIVSAAVHHALLAPRPKRRYPLEPIWHLRKVMPTALFDRILLKKTGLSR